MSSTSKIVANKIIELTTETKKETAKSSYKSYKRESGHTSRYKVQVCQQMKRIFLLWMKVIKCMSQMIMC